MKLTRKPWRSMQRNYNYIYAQLVGKDADLVGHIAYSFYKKSKIEYIEKQQQGGRFITDAELIPFNDFSSSESSIESYRIKAELLVEGFIERVLDSELNSFNKQVINQQAEILKSIIKPIIPSFWNNVWIGLLSSFLFALLVAAFFFIKTFGDYEINIKYKNSEVNSPEIPHPNGFAFKIPV